MKASKRGWQDATVREGVYDLERRVRPISVRKNSAAWRLVGQLGRTGASSISVFQFPANKTTAYHALLPDTSRVPVLVIPAISVPDVARGPLHPDRARPRSFLPEQTDSHTNANLGRGRPFGSWHQASSVTNFSLRRRTIFLCIRRYYYAPPSFISDLI
jgi:hypothetical protein